MKLGIQSRLFFAFIGTITLVVAAMVLAIHWSFERGLEDYLRQAELERLDRLVDTLSQAYGEHGSWEFLHHNQRVWAKLMDEGLGRTQGSSEGEPSTRRFGREQQSFPRHRPPSWPRPPPEGLPHVPPEFAAHPFQPGPPGRRPPRPGFDDNPTASSDGSGASMPPGEMAADSAPIPQPLPPPPPPPPPRHFREKQPQLDPLDLRHRLRLLDADGVLIFGPHAVEWEEFRRPVPWQGETVGFLALAPSEVVTDELALGFQAGQRRTYALITALAVLLSALTSLLLSRRLLRPIRRITAAAKELGAGHYATRIQADRNDELGRLAGDFNHLASALERNEQSRRRWVADISHELRTPLAILRGEIEALLDGVRQTSAERLQSLHGEVLGLGKLVDDLYELALSDLGALDYQRETLDLAKIIEEAVESFRHRFTAKGLELINRVQGPLPLTGDPRRLQQLFTNLLENSRRYTDPGGRLEITLDADAGKNDGCYHLLLQDTAPGVPDQALPKLFERFYRVDKSRSRDLGGAGLGLAICRNIVTAHGGHIEAAD